MKKLIWIIVLMLCPATALSMENTDLLAGIGFPYTPVEGGILGGEYNLQFRYYHDRLLDNFYKESNSRNRINRGEIENAFLIGFNPVNRVSLFTNIPCVYAIDDYRYNYHYDYLSEFWFGDIKVGMKIQVTEPNNILPLVNFLLEYRINTGQGSYFHGIQKTGRGYQSIIGGIAISKNFDPVTPFCHLQYSYHLNEKTGFDYHHYFVKEMRPGSELKLELGLTGSISETISYLAGIDYTNCFKRKYYYSSESDYNYVTGSLPFDDGQVIALINLGAGFKISRVLISPRISFGMTDDSPDFMFNLKIPFGFSVSSKK